MIPILIVLLLCLCCSSFSTIVYLIIFGIATKETFNPNIERGNIDKKLNEKLKYKPHNEPRKKRITKTTNN